MMIKHMVGREIDNIYPRRETSKPGFGRWCSKLRKGWNAL
jgi:hypothetical protein